MSEALMMVRLRRTGTLVSALFGSLTNSIVSLVSIAAAIWLLIPLWRWAVSDAIWSGTAADCNTDAAGACWVFIGNKLRFILFGLYPQALQLRPTLVVVLVSVMLAVCAQPRFWSSKLVVFWLGALIAAWFIMAGTLLTPQVSTSQWGGLRITILVSLAALTFAFPLAVVLALARQSSMRLVRALAVAFIECLRGVPLIAVLYVAMLIVPMALPAGIVLDKLLRAQLGITLFVSAYLAEVVRAGLQSLPSG